MSSGHKSSEVEDDDEIESLWVLNLQDSKIQKVEMPECLYRGIYNDYTLIKSKENQIIKVTKYVELLTVESFERTSNFITDI